MSDCGVVVHVTRSDGGALAAEDLRAVREAADALRSQETGRSELGVTFAWDARRIQGDDRVVLLVLSELWGEDAECLVVEADGSVSPARYTTMEIDSEEVEVPEIPEGNPDGDAILELLLARDLERAEACLGALVERLPRHLACRASADHW